MQMEIRLGALPITSRQLGTGVPSLFREISIMPDGTIIYIAINKKICSFSTIYGAKPLI